MGIENSIRTLTGLPSIYAHDSQFAQMAAIYLPAETDTTALQTWLYDKHRIEVPVLEWNGHKLIRVSVQGYNTPKDIDALVKALDDWYRD